MQLTQKHIIGISIGAVLALLGYLQVQNNTTSQLDGGKISTVSQSGIETDTLKRLKTFSESGTAWNMSPFGSGKPLEEEKKTEFKKPNTEWKTRQVTLKDGRTLTYVFGEGNPKEVALDDKGIEDLATKCADYSQIDYLYSIGSCMGNPSGTSRPLNMYKEVEKYLRAGLSDPDWTHLALDCQSAFRETDKISSLPIGYYDAIFASGYLDMDSFISVNATTGRKSLDLYHINRIINDLDRATTSGGYYNTVAPDNSYGKCVDRYSSHIVENLKQAVYWYLIPE